ncbi:MAG: hypothetical protein K0S47_3110 [Herbinix sp.]|jgi:hypothetical protein|nr:hypothetical protein [Herbinix sp.]
MNYQRADTIFPEELLSEIQKYIQDGLIYVPKSKNLHKKWGDNTGSRQAIQNRNKEISYKFHDKVCIEQLATEYFLSVETIKKIVYKK